MFISYKEGISTKEEIETPGRRCIINTSRILADREGMVPRDGRTWSQRDTFLLFHFFFFFCEPRETRTISLRTEGYRIKTFSFDLFLVGGGVGVVGANADVGALTTGDRWACREQKEPWSECELQPKQSKASKLRKLRVVIMFKGYQWSQAKVSCLWDVHGMEGKIKHTRNILGVEAFSTIIWISHEVGRLPTAEALFPHAPNKAGLLVSIEQKGAEVW